MKTVVICSGGLDSVSLAWLVHDQSNLNLLLSFDYGQRHVKELESARVCADALGVEHLIIDLKGVGQSLAGSALTDDIPVPEGHYTSENMAVTVVPNRNAIMLAVAYGVASARKYEQVGIAVHGGDHYIYPDCRPEFITSFEQMQSRALEGMGEVRTYAPFLTMSKAEIVRAGQKLGVPFEKTWSCYKGEDRHCGRCGTCVERQEAFFLAKVNDPTSYSDTEFWRTTLPPA